MGVSKLGPNSPFLASSLIEDRLTPSQTALHLPSSLADFKNHRRYALVSQLGVRAMVTPGSQHVGSFKGELVYLKKDVSSLKSVYGWRMVGRRVVHEGGTVDGCDEGIGEEGDSLSNLVLPAKVDTKTNRELFGHWQTEVKARPSLIDQVHLPVNAYGSVDMFLPSSMLPLGASHLAQNPFPLALQAASQLGVPFAPALVRFRFEGQAVNPVHDGIVVASVFKEHIVDLCGRLALKAALVERGERSIRVVARWCVLIKGLTMRKLVQDKYGEDELIRDEGSKEGGDGLREGSDELIGGVHIQNQSTSTIQGHSTLGSTLHSPIPPPIPSLRKRMRVCVHAWEELSSQGDLVFSKCTLCGLTDEGSEQL